MTAAPCRRFSDFPDVWKISRMSRRRDNSELSVRTDNRRIAARRIVTTS